MNENLKYIAGAVAVVGLTVGGIVFLSRSKTPTTGETPVATLPVPPSTPEEPAVKYPLPPAEVPVPLPPLASSDEPMQSALAGLIGDEAVQQFVISKELIRHTVVTIDNLTGEKVAERIRSVKPTPGKFAVGGTESATVLDPANYERYKPLVDVIRSIDTRQLITTYTRYYPLFQESYESLGHPPEYFNDRLIEVIDHLLATPEVQGPITLAQPSLLYEFADPELESRSAGQKALIRMGRDNAMAVKAKLSELRSALIVTRPES